MASRSRSGSAPVMHSVIRVVRFGLHAPSRRKRAMLDDALRRQTLAYGRALEAARPHAVERLRLAGRIPATGDRAAKQALVQADRAAQKRIANAAYAAARAADCSSIMCDGLAEQVQATVQSWIGWRLRFRAERPGRVKRAAERLAEVKADPEAAVKALQARRPRATITIKHVLSGAEARLARERTRPPPAYPVGPRVHAAPADRAAMLSDLAASASKAEEDRLRDALARDHKLGRTPLCWTRASGDLTRGIALLRGDGGRIDGFLPGILPAKAKRARKLHWSGERALVGVKAMQKMPRCIGLRVPLSFGRQAWQYLDGWSPRTAKLVAFPLEGGWRYELHVAFERKVEDARSNDAVWIGLDRGVANIAAAADEAGVRTFLAGNRLAPVERRLRSQRERAQQRGRARAMRATRRAFRDAARNEVNRIAKHVARLAIRTRARLAAEDLQAFARGDARTLSRAQYAALLQAVERRLELAGYAPIARDGKRVWTVRAAHTSTTCAACGAMDPASRIDRDRFACTACGHVADADLNAACNIARRGRETFGIARGRKAAGMGAKARREVHAGVVTAPAAAAGGQSAGGGANSPIPADGLRDVAADAARQPAAGAERTPDAAGRKGKSGLESASCDAIGSSGRRDVG